MPKGIPIDQPTVLRQLRIYAEDLEKLKRFYPSGYSYPLMLLIHRHVEALERHSREAKEKILTPEELEAIG